MAGVRLTETAIRAAISKAAETGARREVADAGQPGLRLRVTPAGSASWVLGCRDQSGAPRRFLLGAFPALGISDARQRARALREEVRKGADPTADARRKRAQAKDAKGGIGTLAALLDQYERQAEGGGRKSWPESKRRIGSVFAPFMAKPIASLSAPDLQMHADAYAARQAASAAVRYLRPVLKWAAARGYVPAGAAAIHPPATVKRRDRVLTRDELRRLLPVLSNSPSPYCRALLFMLLTLARREEVCSARWRDVDPATGEWRIGETKNGAPHVVPLSGRALALLGEPGAPDALLFPSAVGGHLQNWDRETKIVMSESKTEGWHRHDLRRTGATMLGDLGVEPHVIEAALNHASIHSQLAATYNRARYRPAVKAALEMLAAHLDGIERNGAEIIPLHRSAAP